MNKKILKHLNGFTLIEILVALFIFTIVAIIMTHALHTVFSSQTATDQRSERLAELQTTLLLVSRDLEQSINRPTTNNQGAKIAAFIGASQSVQFTHGGLANPQGQAQRSTLQRTEYFIENNFLIRRTWPALDQEKRTLPDQRKLMGDVSDLRFVYYNEAGNSFTRWPPAEQKSQTEALPHAVKITLVIKKWGSISQLYLTPGQTFGTH